MSSPDISPNLALPYLLPAQAQKHVTHNEALALLDVLAQLVVQDFAATTPPAAPNEGEVWAIGENPFGAWIGQDGHLAAWVGGAWHFIAPRTGWRATGLADGSLRTWSGSAWVRLSMDNLSGVGIGTEHDATNRLAVAADATLLSHAGADHRLVLNKANATDTASLLFQSAWSGHAEMGLAGDTDFSIKVSPDGTNWFNGLVVDSASGTVTLPSDLVLEGSVTGSAVSQSTTDATAGRLLRVGDGGLLAAQVPRITDFTQPLFPGFYDYLEASAIGAPGSGAVWAGHALVNRLPDGAIWVLATRRNPANPRTWIGTRSGTTGPLTWVELIQQSSIVGAVNQSGGMPTGAVLERGSNSNGEYVRFADGTQICWTYISPNWTNPINQLFSYPAAFVAGPAASISARSGTPEAVNNFATVKAYGGAGTSTYFLQVSGTGMNGTGASYQLAFMSVGRWF